MPNLCASGRLTVIQARCGSTRLPGKILLPLGETNILLEMVRRVHAAKSVGSVVVATTQDSVDEPIVSLCEAHGVPCYRGHATDLLDRHYQVAKLWGAQSVVKIPSDCPLIDPEVIDKVLHFFDSTSSHYDYVSNLHPGTYPDGNDVEVMAFSTLEKAWQEASEEIEREHTTPYIWQNPHLFRLANVAWETGLDYSNTYRYTLDYEEDYRLIREVFNHLGKGDTSFGVPEIVGLLETHSDIRGLNAKYVGETWWTRYQKSNQEEKSDRT